MYHWLKTGLGSSILLILHTFGILQAGTPELLTPRGDDDDEKDSPSPTRSTFKRSESEEVAAEQPVHPLKIGRRLSDPSECTCNGYSHSNLYFELKAAEKENLYLIMLCILTALLGST